MNKKEWLWWIRTENRVGQQSQRGCFIIVLLCFVLLVCFKRKLIAKQWQLQRLCSAPPSSWGTSHPAGRRKGCWGSCSPPTLTHGRGRGGSRISASAARSSLHQCRPPAQFRPVISLDFDLMQQLLVMWFEGDKCPVQGWLALMLIPLMM